MNKQIKDLWEESQQWNGSDDGRGGLKIHESVEKFAELIVRECASRVTSKANRWGNMRDEIINECILKCATDLKQHFGVEE